MQRCFDTLVRSGTWMERVKDPAPGGVDIVVCRCCRSSGQCWEDVPHARWCGIPAALRGAGTGQAAREPAGEAPTAKVVALSDARRVRLGVCLASTLPQPGTAGATVVALSLPVPVPVSIAGSASRGGARSALENRTGP